MNRRRTSQLLCSLIAAAGLLTACAAENPDDGATADTTGVGETTGGPTDASTEPSSVPTAASSVPTDPPSVSSPPAATIADEGSTIVSTGGIDPGLQPYIDIAVADLAKRFSLDASNVSVISAKLVSWPDSALGCPKPGQQYAQVATDGSVIVLKIRDTLYRYHSGGSRKPFLCEQP
jgi:hypothetical protein